MDVNPYESRRQPASRRKVLIFVAIVFTVYQVIVAGALFIIRSRRTKAVKN